MSYNNLNGATDISYQSSSTGFLTYRGRQMRYAMAPMVAASDFPFRCLCRQQQDHQLGGDQQALPITNPDTSDTSIQSSTTNTKQLLTYTQMMHARSLVKDAAFVRNHFDLYEYSAAGSVQENGSSSLVLPLLLTPQINALGRGRTSNHQEATEIHKNGASSNSHMTELHPFASSVHTRGPVMAQLAGNDPTTMVQAAELLLQRTNGQ
jgi:tRNA-dihydrouridine synthase